MNPDYNQRLEQSIHRELRELPDLIAPATITNRVMSALARQESAVWWRRSWETWPVAIRAAAFVLLAAIFVGLCFGSRELWDTTAVLAARHQIANLFEGLSALWGTVLVLGRAVVLVVEKLGTGFMVACLTLAAFSYLACVGLGTMAVRLASSHRRRFAL